ncbi:flavodoxin family protein [Marinococcus halophilus]|uniref:8-demethyl-8-aminoriboflavin-5'-phosphate (AFP) synthase RosB n=1 Tax=Marinococcus halophilus TaxID=1371 RepID=A0A510Y304_MARHA|nr:flavodoxin family protein [Marinococcus halophilus]OZT81626.1 flavodoxin family protein [Marinococcus halophilus]GEK57573.1 8-demethyl-8-aminoriboflavin-5'-phosphate (AFP) synthase RosB [Marinococcus halophilus]
MKAVFLNGSLKDSSHTSNTDALADEIMQIWEEEGVQVEKIRLADYNIPYGVADDLGEGDDWPAIQAKIEEAEMVLLGTPVWLGEKSSMITKAIERLNGSASHTNEKGQGVYYDKVAGVVATGNEDGAKHAIQSIVFGLSHLGFTLPPRPNCYWVGEAGPGPSFIEAEGIKSEFVQKHIPKLAYNMLHVGTILKENPIPTKGNT